MTGTPTADEVQAVTAAIIDKIIDAGGTIDFKVQPVARAAILALDTLRSQRSDKT